MKLLRDQSGELDESRGVFTEVRVLVTRPSVAKLKLLLK